MAFNTSGVFGALLEDALENTAAFDLADTTAASFKAALYGNSITPSVDVTAANSAHGVDQWLTDIFDTTNWDDGGEPLTSVTFTRSSGVLTWDAADTPQGGANCTLSAVYGCQVYADVLTTPVADQGVCFNDFGGSQSVTAGVTVAGMVG